MATTTTTRPRTEPVVELLAQAYRMELESALDYLAASVNLDGIRAQEVARALGGDVGEELGHARRLAARLKELDAVVPGAAAVSVADASWPGEQVDVERTIRGAIEAERAAIEVYRELVEEVDGYDWVTQDLAVSILADEEAHLRRLEGFLREYEEGPR